MLHILPLTAASAVALNQGFRTCGTRIPLVVREGLSGFVSK